MGMWNALAAEVASRDEHGRFRTAEDERHGASETAQAILCGIAEAHPYLPAVGSEAFEVLQAESKALIGAEREHRAPTHDGPVPDGSVKLAAFLDSGSSRHNR